MPISQRQIREQLLKEKGLSSFKPSTRKSRRIRSTTPSIVNRDLKTPMMLYLELEHGEPIERMLVSGSLSVVSKKLGIDTSTVSKWIKRLKLRYNEDNLPQCDYCQRRGPACEGGVCYILLDLELYSLMPLKRKEMFE